jgi:hypothetical protein
MPGIEDTEQIQYEKFDELQRKNEELARQLKEKIKLVGKTNVAFLPLSPLPLHYSLVLFLIKRADCS